MCGESDTSDRTKGSSTESGARAPRLLIGAQIQHNQEETLRIQRESLEVAESHIAALTARNSRLQHELDRKTDELREWQQSGACSRGREVAVCCQVTPEVGGECYTQLQLQRIRALQENVSVMEDLYLECFTEAANQDRYLDLLRDSYYHVRSADNNKSTEIDRLRTIINTQNVSLDKCQGVAVEVENLKTDICNFLNGSNNDSGVWERCEDSVNSEIHEELRDIMMQLLQLRDILLDGCECNEEHELRTNNKALEKQVEASNRRIAELENLVCEKDRCLNMHVEEARGKEDELRSTRDSLQVLERNYEQLRRQLHQTREQLSARSSELETARVSGCELQQAAAQTSHTLTQRLQAAEHLIQSCRCAEELPAVRELSARETARADRLQHQLDRERRRCGLLQDAYRDSLEQAELAGRLQSELSEATKRGARLCADSRRVVAALRNWAAGLRDQHRKQGRKLREKDKLIERLRRQLSGDLDTSSGVSCWCQEHVRADRRTITTRRGTSVVDVLPAREPTATSGQLDVTRECEVSDKSDKQVADTVH